MAGWNGYAEEHGIVLDFEDRLNRFGPGDPLVLCLAGWVEYPFSQTNYAAATAGVSLRSRSSGGGKTAAGTSSKPMPAALRACPP